MIFDTFNSPDNPHNHKSVFCDSCGDWTVICGACGNNTCNGSSGKVNGVECCICDSAYEVFYNFNCERENSMTTLFDCVVQKVRKENLFVNEENPNEVVNYIIFGVLCGIETKIENIDYWRFETTHAAAAFFRKLSQAYIVATMLSRQDIENAIVEEDNINKIMAL